MPLPLVSPRRRQSIRVLLVTATLLVAPCAHAVSSRAQLDVLSEAFWQWRATEQPFTDDDIPRIERPATFVVDWSPAAVKRYQTRIADFERRYRALDLSSSPVPDQVDYRLLGSAIARVRWELEVAPDWRQDPFFYVEQTLGSVYVLLLPPPPISAPRQDEVLARMERVPATLAAARENLNEMRGPYVRTTLAALDGIEEHLQQFQTALLPQLDESNRARFQKDLATIQTAIVSYRDWLKSKQPGLPNRPP